MGDGAKWDVVKLEMAKRRGLLTLLRPDLLNWPPLWQTDYLTGVFPPLKWGGRLDCEWDCVTRLPALRRDRRVWLLPVSSNLRTYFLNGRRFIRRRGGVRTINGNVAGESGFGGGSNSGRHRPAGCGCRRSATLAAFSTLC